MKNPLKRFIVKKYIMANSAMEDIKKEKKYSPDDVWIDEDWKKINDEKIASSIGFK